MMTAYMSQTMLATLVGVNQTTISRLVKDGTITHVEDYGVPVQLGCAEALKYASADARRLGGLSDEQRDRLRDASTGELSPDELTGGRFTTGPAPGVNTEAKMAEMDRELDVKERHEKAKMLEAEAKAELKELELKERNGELVNMADVRADAIEMASEINSRLYNLPGKLASRLKGATPSEIEVIVEDEIRQVLKAIHESEFAS